MSALHDTNTEYEGRQFFLLREALVRGAKERCFLTTQERLLIVTTLGRYAPGITNIRDNPRVDILALHKGVASIIDKENESSKGK